MNIEERRMLSATGIVVLFLVIIFCLIPMMSHAGTYYLRWEVPDYDAWAAYDSLRVIAYDANTPNSPACSLNTGSFPFVDSLGPLDSTKAYVVWEFRGYADFDSLAPMSALHISPIEVSASATVDYGEMNDTLSAHHGAGTWTPSGTGSESISIYAYRTSDSALLPGVNITAWNTAQSIQQGRATTTNSAGLATLLLDSGDVVLAAYLTGYTFPTYDTHTVGDGATDSVWGEWCTPDDPDSADLCRVYAYMRDPAGHTMKYKQLTFELEKEAWNACDSTVPYFLPLTVETDTLGKFEIDLYPSTCWAEYGSSTTDTIRYKARVFGQSTWHTFIVPDSTTYRLLWGN